MPFRVIEKNGNHVVSPTLTKSFITNQLIVDLDSNFMNVVIPENHCLFFNDVDSLCQQIMSTTVRHKTSIEQDTNSLTAKLMYRKHRYIVRVSHIDNIPVTIYDLMNYSKFQITVQCNLLHINANSSCFLWLIRDIQILR